MSRHEDCRDKGTEVATLEMTWAWILGISQQAALGLGPN